MEPTSFLLMTWAMLWLIFEYGLASAIAPSHAWKTAPAAVASLLLLSQSLGQGRENTQAPY